jgi:hypothetical protein
MLEKSVYLVTAQMKQSAASFTFHVIACSAAAVVHTDIFITGR